MNWRPTRKKPKRQRNCTVRASAPVPKPRSAKRRTSSIGRGVRSSQATNPPIATAATANPARAPGVVQPASGAFDDSEHERADADAGQHEAGQVDHRVLGVGRVRRQDEGGDERSDGQQGRGDEGGPPGAPLEDQPAAEHAEDGSRAREAGPHANSTTSLVGGEHGGDGRQGARHDHGGADAHDDPAGDEGLRRLDCGGDQGGHPEQHGPAQEQGALMRALYGAGQQAEALLRLPASPADAGGRDGGRARPGPSAARGRRPRPGRRPARRTDRDRAALGLGTRRRGTRR